MVWAYSAGWWIPTAGSGEKHVIRGVDVSNHQGLINWEQAASDGIAFAYIKATEGGDFRDKSFARNWQETKAANVPRGAYHFFTFKASGRAQAENYIATVPKDASALPPAVDLEYWGNSQMRPGVAEFQKQLGEFLALIEAHYEKSAVLYTDHDFSKRYLTGIVIKRLWYRDILREPTREWTLWQYTEKDRVTGIEGFVDRNAFHGNRAEFERFQSEAKR